MIKATISENGQIAIPEIIRERLDLKPGTEVEIDVEGQRLVVQRIASDYPNWRTMEGMIKSGESLTKALEEERRAENAHYERRINQGR